MLSASRKRVSHSAEKMCPLTGNRTAISHVPTQWPSHYTKLSWSNLLISQTVTVAEDNNRHGQWRGQVHNTDKHPWSKDQFIVPDWREHLWPFSISNVLISGLSQWKNKYGSRSIPKKPRRHRGGKDMGLRNTTPQPFYAREREAVLLVQ